MYGDLLSMVGGIGDFGLLGTPSGDFGQAAGATKESDSFDIGQLIQRMGHMAGQKQMSGASDQSWQQQAMSGLNQGMAPDISQVGSGVYSLLMPIQQGGYQGSPEPYMNEYIRSLLGV